MSEEQMNELISVLKRIGDELEISNISQSKRKYMRRILEIREEKQHCKDMIKLYQNEIDTLEKEEDDPNSIDYIEKYKKWTDHYQNSIKRLREEELSMRESLDDELLY